MEEQGRTGDTARDRAGTSASSGVFSGKSSGIPSGASGTPSGASSGTPSGASSDTSSGAGDTGKAPGMDENGVGREFGQPEDLPAEPAEAETVASVSSPAEGGGEQLRIQGVSQDLAASYLDQLQRLKAEFDNYRRRVSREKEEWFRLAKAEVVAGLLPVLDDLRRARDHARSSEEAPDAQGLLLILKRFEDILAQLGLEEQDTRDGLEFDPEKHEAVLATPSADVAEGCIVRTLEPGYLFDGRLLRPSKVSVSSGPPPE